MRFFLPFFCLFLLTACQGRDIEKEDYEDDFLLVAHQSIKTSGSDYGQEVDLQAIVRNRVADDAGSGLWLRTTLPWLRIGGGQLDTRDLARLGDRAEPFRRFQESGTLSRVKNGRITETRLADPELEQRLQERFGDKIEQLLDQSTATAVPLPDDPQPGDTWQASASLWGLPKVEADYRVLARDGERVLVAMTLNGERVEGQARMIARWPSGMPEALRLHSELYMPDQDALVEQRLQLVSQRHYPNLVRDWDVDPTHLQMQADFQKRQFREMPLREPDDTLPLRDRADMDALLDSLEDSFLYQVEEQRVMTRGDWALAAPLQQQAELHFTGFNGDAPDGLVLNRMAENGGFFRLADPGPPDMDLGRDLLIATAPDAFQPGKPLSLTAEARIWEPAEPVTLTKGDPVPDGVSVLDWGKQRLDLRLEDGQPVRAQPLDADGRPLPMAMTLRPVKQADESPETFIERLSLNPAPLRLSLRTDTPIAALRLTPMESRRRALTMTVRPQPDDGDLHPPGARHQLPGLRDAPDDTARLLRDIELQALDHHRLRVTGPIGFRLCNVVPEGAPDYHGTPLHFTWSAPTRHEEDGRPGFELRTKDDRIRYFYGRRLSFEARCPTRVETVVLTREQPGCAHFEGDNGVLLGDDCKAAHYDALDDTGLALRELGEDDNGVLRFWGPVKSVRLLRTHGEQTRTLEATLPELPQ
ncbi:hypothetical protein [Alloalcanivorax marinus]|uniref:hypothetical protein n=1 Tax=Alloalcanivorax marinus TaxID=1177169 RepID=UPI001932AFF8|nr:hypothetical protein [Alloalcanivorax marinus]MBL7249976.1 hypothetical protein [Alloalcanivorax marinus]